MKPREIGAFLLLGLLAVPTILLIGMGLAFGWATPANAYYHLGGSRFYFTRMLCWAAKPRSLEGLEFDVNPPSDTLSWSFADVNGDGVEDLLVSDSEGRIWFYKGMAVTTPVGEDADGTVSYQLQHKVWGGSFAGFAQGLRIAAVDWDDDGDLDCLAGTAEGKLMLLRDPKVGRPTNLKAEA